MNTFTLRGLRTAAILQRVPYHASLAYRPRSASKHILSSQLRSASSITKSPTQEHDARPRSLLNGPLSTHPPPLTIPTRAPGSSTFSYYYSIGKTYLKFYKTGVIAIYSNFRSIQALQSLIDTRHSSSIPAAVSANSLTRSDFQLLYRSWHDMKRVPLFALVFCVCGEFTPLVVIAVSSVVPWTCRIPRQISADRTKLEKRRAVSFRNLTAIPPMEKGVQGLERMQLIHVSWSLGLSSSAWDWLGGQYPGLPTGILRRKVGKTVGYLEMDDKLLGDGSRIGELEIEEVRMALVERGVDVQGREDRKLRADLEAWLKSREKGAPVERLLLTRPSIWPIKPKYLKDAD